MLFSVADVDVSVVLLSVCLSVCLSLCRWTSCVCIAYCNAVFFNEWMVKNGNNPS
jgi:hypothetical protein